MSYSRILCIDTILLIVILSLRQGRLTLHKLFFWVLNKLFNHIIYHSSYYIISDRAVTIYPHLIAFRSNWIGSCIILHLKLLIPLIHNCTNYMNKIKGYDFIDLSAFYRRTKLLSHEELSAVTIAVIFIFVMS